MTRHGLPVYWENTCIIIRVYIYIYTWIFTYNFYHLYQQQATRRHCQARFHRLSHGDFGRLSYWPSGGGDLGSMSRPRRWPVGPSTVGISVTVNRWTGGPWNTALELAELVAEGSGNVTKNGWTIKNGWLRNRTSGFTISNVFWRTRMKFKGWLRKSRCLIIKKGRFVQQNKWVKLTIEWW